MQIQIDSCCGLISKGRLSDFKTLRMATSLLPSRCLWQAGQVKRLLGRLYFD
jgi:hypothetical protein